MYLRHSNLELRFCAILAFWLLLYFLFPLLSTHFSSLNPSKPCPKSITIRAKVGILYFHPILIIHPSTFQSPSIIIPNFVEYCSLENTAHQHIKKKYQP